MLKDHGRYPYSSLPSRPKYEWPNGTKVAVYVAMNIEAFSFGEGKGAAIAPPDQAHSHSVYSWRDYGNRVGIWRIFDLLQDMGVSASHNINYEIFKYAPEIAQRISERCDEMVGHGRTNSERQGNFSEQQERELISESTKAIKSFTGNRPTGWLSPFLSETDRTPDLLKEAGYDYILNWPCDDQPFWMRTCAGPILSVPYTIELNDLPVIVNTWRYTPRQYAQMIIDQFDEMLKESERRPLVFCFVLHTFVLGHPFRIRPIRGAMEHIMRHRNDLWLTTPGEIAAYCKAMPPGIIPGRPDK